MFANFLQNNGIDVSETITLDTPTPALESASRSQDNDSLDSVDVAIASAVNAAQEVENFVSRANSLSVGIDAMDSIHQIATEAQGDGGLTAREGKLIEQRVSDICGLIGAEAPDMPATENFGSSSPRSVATEMVATEAAETIKKWAKTVSDWIVKQFNSFMALLEKYFEAGQRLKGWAEGAKPKIEKLGELKESDAKVKFDKMLVDSKGVLLSGKALADDTKALESFVNKDITDLTKVLDESFKLAGDGKSKVAEVYNDAFVKGIDGLGWTKDLGGSAATEFAGLEVKASNVMLGQFQLIAGYSKEAEAAFKKASIKVRDVKVDEVKELETTPLSKEEMLSISGSVIECADTITSVKKQINASVKEAKKAAAVISSKDEKEAKSLQSSLQKITGFYSSGPMAATQKSILSLRAATGAVKASMGAYKTA